MRHQAIYNTHSNALYIKSEIAYDENDVQIDLDETKVQTEIDRLQSIEDAQLYARNRAAEYPSNGDQWDMIYKDNLNGTTTHKDAVEAVKTKWPKDNSGPVE